MSLSNSFKVIKDYVLRIRAYDGYGKTIGSGTGFIFKEYVITNFHVFNLPDYATIKLFGCNFEKEIELSIEEWRKSLVTSSAEDSFDYAILRIEKVDRYIPIQSLKLGQTADCDVGDHVAFVGYPMGQQHMSCHSGYISAKYQSNITKIIQIDASANNGNSGGPLFKAATGELIGIITRKESGLSSLFKELRSYLLISTKVLSGIQGGISMSGVSLIQVLQNNNQSVLKLMDEIERQANVGIGYAFSIQHVIENEVVKLV